MSQTIDRQLQEYIPLLNARQKKSVLEMIKSYLQPVEKPERISREQYNKEIDEAEARMDAGRYISIEDLEKDAETW